MHEHLRRFIERGGEHGEPFWYYIPIVLAILFPWSFFIPPAFARAFRGGGGRESDPRLFLALWAAVVAVFFSIPGGKLATYILPALPAAALLLGDYLSTVLDTPSRVFTRTALAVSILLAAAGAAAALAPLVTRASGGAAIHVPGVFAVGGMVLCAGGLFAFSAARRRNGEGFVAALGTSLVLSSILLLPPAIGMAAGKRSGKPLALILRDHAGPGTVVASYGYYDRGLAFYTARRTALVGVRNELEFGSRVEETSDWFLEYAGFYRLWDSGRPVCAFITKRDMKLFRASVRTPPRVLGKCGRRLAVTNRPGD